jgi:hypothetical protein
MNYFENKNSLLLENFINEKIMSDFQKVIEQFINF